MPTTKAFTNLKNPMVRLWNDKDGHIYKIEIRSDEFLAYIDPPKGTMMPNA